MDINTIYGILAAIGLSVVIMIFQRKKKQASWQGTVTKIKEKLYDPNNYSENNTNFKDLVDIYYHTDSGKKGILHLYKNQFDSLYPELKVGDQMIKEAGKEYPRPQNEKSKP